MTTLKRRDTHDVSLTPLAWIAVALTPVGWFYGVLTVAYAHLGDVVVVNDVILGSSLFVVAPTSAFILAVHAARSGHRSGKIALIVSGLLLLATLIVTALYGGWIGLAVTAVAAVLVLAGVCSHRIAVVVSVVVSGLLLTAVVVLPLFWGGGLTGLAVIAVIAVLVFAWAQSRNKPPPGPDGTQREEGSPADTAPPGASEQTS